LEWSEALEQAAKDHYRDIASKGSFSHAGSDGSNYKDRIERYCKWGGAIFEACDFAPREDALDVVIAWVVDDANPKRSNRLNLLSVNHKHVAVVSGSHSQARNCSVGVFAAQVIPKGGLKKATSKGPDS